MSAEQGNTGNKIRKLCIYALLCAGCMVIGYIESLLQLSFIAPGIKIGLSNAVACVLILKGDIKGAFAVNISRILLSALLFGSPVSLVFALAGGVISLSAMVAVRKAGKITPVGISALGGAVHNTAQCAVAVFFVGRGAVFYMPVLLIAGVACGAAVGLLASIVSKRIG